MEKQKPEKMENEKEAPLPIEEPEEIGALEVEKDVITEIPHEEELEKVESSAASGDWKPKTSIGKKVLSGEIKDINELFESGAKILEAQIVDALIPGMESELLMIGQAKGKFGGGQRRVFRQTQKKTPEGNSPSFSCISVVGNNNGYVGIGWGKSRDTVPAREKSFRNAKLNLFKIRRGCGSWECGCKTPHSIPFEAEGRCGSVRIRLIPAPKGKGLIIEPECAKILKFAGIKDVWSKTSGQTRIKTNLINACVSALKNLTEMKMTQIIGEKVGLIEGKIEKPAEEEQCQK